MMEMLIVTTGILRHGKSAVTLPPPAYQHSVYYRPDALPLPNQCQSTENIEDNTANYRCNPAADQIYA